MTRKLGPMVRFFLLTLFVVLAAAAVVAASFGTTGWVVLGVLVLLLVGLGLHDLFQTKHAILRNFPVLGRMRYLLESIRPEIQQYFIERNTDGRPFDRDTRSLIYTRSKGADSHKAFGTERDVNSQGYEFLLHSSAPLAPPEEHHRVRIGGPDCRKPYDIALMNISSMSFGSLSKNAVQAMNKGAAMGGFVHATGEGGLTKYHLEHGADVFWEIGSGYFGCRDEHGRFAPETFRTKAATDAVKAVTIKLSQGAKPGIGGVLPKSKITPEIAEARGIPMDRDCVSPASHSAFHTPRELMEFVGTLRELTEGKPIGYKFCVGSRTDVLAMCKAMLDTGITPDYIIIDGSEGGTGAAPLEYEDHIGTPLTEGLMLVHNALVGAGLRDRIRLGAAGKVASGSDIVKRLIQGADFTMSARSMMMATGCIQAQLCHTNRCPVGVATQNPRLMRAVDVEDKGNRVYNYQKLTVTEAEQIMASMGVSTPANLNQRMLRRRIDHLTTSSYAALYNWLRPGELLEDPPRGWSGDWDEADADHFGEHAPIPWLQPSGGPGTGEPVRSGGPRRDRPDMARWDETSSIDQVRVGPSRDEMDDTDTGKTKRVETSGVRPESRPGG
ncbi:MAG: FMN-binding glutamate synthase family protein [Arthrobacter sp.]|uniref:FMN-binding glutamate synthase family protein n=1 Tax=unclassified Arthrobacter TaxID=235627 RepID=UPI002650E1AE|nr:FMN-binding glutamate synthase family protein [Micrococcaceae bacterium]MDN5824319.1 FMN-binding glutamate synthase family protein [Micrococcaceae bacterium]MDN5880379.1 FMN-binding glutamate synthase family protein [Micrococcaceae bacterium]MDN5886422.1 FMN-binding glutamate synthase family protein [Micrococcaceae bacterium]MDN5906082.1 FMN-binding glutamate synthase family protein [Micrococcaceae bacterium]